MNKLYTNYYFKMAGGELYGSFGFDHKEVLTSEEEAKMKDAFVRMLVATTDYKAEEIEYISKEEYERDADQTPKRQLVVDVDGKTIEEIPPHE